MDIFRKYISRNQSFNLIRFHIVLLVICILITIVSTGSVWMAFHRPSFQELIREMPTIEIMDGVVRLPQNTVWEKEIPETNTKVHIDTTRDYPVTKGENGIFLGRRGFSVLFQQREEVYPFTNENLVLDQKSLLALFQRSLLNLAGIVFTTFMIFLIFGYWGTVLLSRVILWLFRQKKEKRLIYRSSVIGWYAIAVLNVLLIVSGYGFSFLAAVAFATILSVSCVFQTQAE